LNTFLRGFRHQLIDTINGRTIRKLDDVHAALNEDVDFHLIRTLDGGRPIVLSQDAAERATARIQARYGISSTVNLGE
jgi:tRNA U54 and U55 pseudouridine synthase Pus10